MEYIIVGLGGFLGSCLRFGISRALPVPASGFPLATLVENALAGFIVGLVYELSANSENITPRTKLFLTTGMMGGLSTFSAFSYETVSLWGKNKHWLACGNVALNLVFSFGGAVLGMMAARLLKNEG